LCAAAFVATMAPSRDADANPGFRLGVTDDPDALFLGFSYAIPLSGGRSGVFVFEPGIDLGVGDDALDFFIRGTGHFKYLIPIGASRDVVIYPLFGPEIIHFEFDGPADDTEVGVDLGFGFGFRQVTFELWVGLSDVPDITLAFAFHF
jgi:hypothetical protein